MGILEDILKALDRVEVWKELQAVPQRTAELERRISEIEAKYGGKWPPDVCRFCGEREVRLHAVMGPMTSGAMHETWVCKACNGNDVRLRKPS